VLIRFVGVGMPVLQDSFCRIQPTELDEELVVLPNPFVAMPRTSLSGLGLRGPILALNQDGWDWFFSPHPFLLYNTVSSSGGKHAYQLGSRHVSFNPLTFEIFFGKLYSLAILRQNLLAYIWWKGSFYLFWLHLLHLCIGLFGLFLYSLS